MAQSKGGGAGDTSQGGVFAGPDSMQRRAVAPDLSPTDIQTVLADVTHKPGVAPDAVKKKMRKGKGKIKPSNSGY